MPPKPTTTSRLKSAARVAGGIATIALLGLAALMLIPAALGLKRYVITSGSMTGTYDQGSIVYDEQVPVSALKVGDPITYAPPAGAGPKGLVTHRIVWRGRDRNGTPAFRTKGDHNKTADPWTFTLDQAKQARVVFHVPYLGYAFSALAIRQVRMIAIGLPALLIALVVVGRLWRDAGEEARRRREAAQGPPPTEPHGSNA